MKEFSEIKECIISVFEKYNLEIEPLEMTSNLEEVEAIIKKVANNEILRELLLCFNYDQYK